jgi:hypothetical protein
MQRHGVVQGQLTTLANDSYTLTTTEGATIFLTNEPYSKICGDYNPIHIGPILTRCSSFINVTPSPERYELSLDFITADFIYVDTAIDSDSVRRRQCIIKARV